MSKTKKDPYQKGYHEGFKAGFRKGRIYQLRLDTQDLDDDPKPEEIQQT